MYASVARFCVRNRRWVLLAWVLLFAVGIVVGSQVFNQLKDTNGASGAESVQGSSILDKASSAGPSAVVLVRGPGDAFGRLRHGARRAGAGR
jgi:RND superfamily putative drug exporter